MYPQIIFIYVWCPIVGEVWWSSWGGVVVWWLELHSIHLSWVRTGRSEGRQIALRMLYI